MLYQRVYRKHIDIVGESAGWYIFIQKANIERKDERYKERRDSSSDKEDAGYEESNGASRGSPCRSYARSCVDEGF